MIQLSATVVALAFALTGATGCGSSASAFTPKVGVGDNGPMMFADKNYKSLGTTISRKIVPYDFYHHSFDRANLKAWMAGAEAAGVEPMIAFSRSEKHPRTLPTVANFQKSLKYLRKNYPEVRAFTPWNEANHKTQPTYKNPIRAAEYYNAARKICTNCQIVGADVLDQANMLPWIASFRTKAYKPKLWGLHSYMDVNRNAPWSRSAAKKLLAAVPGNLWLTEIGGIVAFANTYSYNETRAANGVKNTLKLSLRDRRIQRVYLYSWYGTDQKHRKPYLWDSGLTSVGGVPRPAFYTLRSWLKAHPQAK